jgi:DNA-binding transcriptional ArsR family regulator
VSDEAVVVQHGDVSHRAALHAALGDSTRLMIVDELVRSDRSPVELGQLTGAESNLLAHHLDVLDEVGVITRRRSSGDGRRRYVHLERTVLADLQPAESLRPQMVVFVCTTTRRGLSWRRRCGRR